MSICVEKFGSGSIIIVFCVVWSRECLTLLLSFLLFTCVGHKYIGQQEPKQLTRKQTTLDGYETEHCPHKLIPYLTAAELRDTLQIVTEFLLYEF